MIRATGVLDGNNITVEYDKKRALFNGRADKMLQERLFKRLKSRPVVGEPGYRTQSPYDQRNIIGVLADYFFDEPCRNIEVIGEMILEIPQPEGEGAFY